MIPTVNVDGLAFIEAQYNKNGTAPDKRTNMNIETKEFSEDCTPTMAGVDLNRNYGFKFGEGASSKTECENGSDTYRGPSAFSEKET